MVGRPVEGSGVRVLVHCLPLKVPGRHRITDPSAGDFHSAQVRRIAATLAAIISITAATIATVENCNDYAIMPG